MPAPTTVILGKDLLLMVGASLIGGQRTATLNWDVSTNQTNTKTNSDWASHSQGLVGWGIDFDGLLLEGAGGNPARGYGASLAVRVVGGTTYTPLSGLKDMSIAFSMDGIEIANQDHGGFRIIRPSIRSAVITPTLDYIDMNATNGDALKTIYDAHKAGNDVEWQLSFGAEGSTLNGVAMPVPQSLSADADNPSEFGLELRVQGEPTETVVGLDAGLQILLDAIFADPMTAITAKFGHIDGAGTAYLADTTQFTGDCYPTALEITIPVEGDITASGTLSGASNLTDQVVPAPV